MITAFTIIGIIATAFVIGVTLIIAADEIYRKVNKNDNAVHTNAIKWADKQK